ncbi:hypothetical protein LCGC14_0662640 [marine sediment metagenome]
MKNLFMLSFLVLTACSSVSPQIQFAAADALQLKQAAADIDASIGKTVRWGGKIISVSNEQDQSSLQIVQFPLSYIGRPVESKASQGRFIVQTTKFLDPEVYKKDELVTVVGTLTSSQVIQVDQKKLTLPVLEMTETHRWSRLNPSSGLPYNPKHDQPFVGYGYYGTGSYSP